MRQQQRPISKNRGGSNGGGTLCNSDHALVKWKDGVYEGRITHDVNVDWIVNFDSVSPEYPETYAIEWRVLPKPRNGWPVYNGLVMDVSSDLDYLKSKAEELRLSSSDDDQSDTGDNLRNSRSPSNTLMDINSEAFKQLVLSLTAQHREGHQGSRQGNRSSESTPSEEQVQVGKSLWVPLQTHLQALHACSPGRMIRPLLRRAFSRRRLVKSTYAGQKRKRNGIEVVKPGLKKYQKMADIHAFVLKRYPHISQAAFGGLVNSFLGEGPNAVHTVEYVQESASESESED